MSFGVGKSAQESQSDVKGSPAGRLEGLVLALGDFHALMNQLDVIYGELYKVAPVVHTSLIHILECRLDWIQDLYINEMLLMYQ